MRARAIEALLVFAGGAVGTGLRLGLDAAVPHPDDEFPVSTLAINVAGSFVLGALVAGVWTTAPAALRSAIGTGVLGGFTTFSALVGSAATLTAAGSGWIALAYVAVSIVVGLAAAAGGLLLGGRLRPGSRMPSPRVDE